MNQRPDTTDDLPVKLAAPARRALAGAGISRLDQLTAHTEDEIRQWHGMGPMAINQLRLALADHGLTFASAQQEGR